MSLPWSASRACTAFTLRARELELESHALLVALASELAYLGALGRPGDLALQLRDSGVALLERRLVVIAGLGGGVIAHGFYLRLRRLVALLRLVLQVIYDPSLP